MAYTDEQRGDHVSDLQNALYQISLQDTSIPRVNPDGIFGTETTQSVEVLQQKNNLPITGKVDRATWDAIFAQYVREIQQRSAPVGITPYVTSPLRIVPGDMGAGIGMAQLMLFALSRNFQNIQAVPLTLRYDEATMAQIRAIQRLSGLPADGIMDTQTWNALVILYNVMDSK